MHLGHTLRWTVLALALTVPLAGCAGKVRLSSQKMCEAHGGTYNAQAKQCTHSTQPVSAKQICERQGGYYDPDADYCEMGMD